MHPLHGLAIASALLMSLPLHSWPAEAGDRHRHHRGGHPDYGGGQHVFYDGPCRIERKWNGHGGYKEKSQCGYGYAPGYYAYPAPVYYYPPPPRYVPHGPSISVTIPLD